MGYQNRFFARLMDEVIKDFFPDAPAGTVSSTTTRTESAPVSTTTRRVFRSEGCTELELDLPGRGRDDLTLKVDGNVLVIQSEATDGRVPRGAERVRFKLDDFHVRENITAQMDKGVLVVRIPHLKKADPETINIEIQ